MIKDKNNRGSYSEEFDILGLQEIAAMAARYVARENHVRIPGKDVPSGEYSDFDCNVWELFTSAVQFGVDLANAESADKVLDSFRWKYGRAN